MSSPQQEVVQYVTYATEAAVPSAAAAVAGGMRFGTIIASLDLGRIRRLINNNGTPAYQGGGSSAPGLSGIASVGTGTSTVVVPVTGMTSTAVVMISLDGAFDATLTRVTYTPTTGSFTITGNANATSSVKVSWLVVSLS